MRQGSARDEVAVHVLCAQGTAEDNVQELRNMRRIVQDCAAGRPPALGALA